MTAASKPRTIRGHALSEQKRYSIADSFRGLMAAVISRALADLGRGGLAANVSGHVRDEAMAWINNPECETYCLILDLDYRTIRERAVALYRRFLERDDGREKARGRPRTSAGRKKYKMTKMTLPC